MIYTICRINILIFKRWQVHLDKFKIIAILALILLILIIIVLNSRTRIYKTYEKYMRVDNKLNITGKQLAFFAKTHLCLTDLQFALTPKKLGDAYVYKYKTLLLSQEVCNYASLSSLAIVAHELGHAMQHKNNSTLFHVVIFTNKLTRLTSKLIFPLLIFGLFFFAFKYPTDDFGYILMLVSASLFILQILNKFFNIPLEYDASRRALKYLKENNFVTHGEYSKAKKLLGIAAQTYIASLFDELIPLNSFKNKKRRK